MLAAAERFCLAAAPPWAEASTTRLAVALATRALAASTTLAASTIFLAALALATLTLALATLVEAAAFLEVVSLCSLGRGLGTSRASGEPGTRAACCCMPFLDAATALGATALGAAAASACVDFDSSSCLTFARSSLRRRVCSIFSSTLAATLLSMPLVSRSKSRRATGAPELLLARATPSLSSVGQVQRVAGQLGGVLPQLATHHSLATFIPSTASHASKADAFGASEDSGAGEAWASSALVLTSWCRTVASGSGSSSLDCCLADFLAASLALAAASFLAAVPSWSLAALALLDGELFTADPVALLFLTISLESVMANGEGSSSEAFADLVTRAVAVCAVALAGGSAPLESSATTGAMLAILEGAGAKASTPDFSCCCSCCRRAKAAAAVGVARPLQQQRYPTVPSSLAIPKTPVLPGQE
mmetsp:Transcript_56250/g.134879  ORF Transcript_56250/g.134879 Transcript_56250/m.134879 type:complete len:421 (+) Transcript_56250:1809-3071(+)